MYTIEQYFNIQSISVKNIANSSVFQIGTSGVIQAQSFSSDAASSSETLHDHLQQQFVVPLPNPS